MSWFFHPGEFHFDHSFSHDEGAYRTLFLYVSIIVITVYMAYAAGAHGAESENISAVDAYNRLRMTGELVSVTVTEEFDFTALGGVSKDSKSPGTLIIGDVQFKKPVRLVGSGFKGNLEIQGARFKDTVLFEDCTLKTMVLRNSQFSAPFVAHNCEFQDINRLDGNEYGSDARFHAVRFLHRASFASSIFHGRAEFLASEFGRDDPLRKATSFSNIKFEGPALFNNAIFHGAVRFQASAFEQDAGFLNVQMKSGGSFGNVHFKGDAEFRFSKISEADFGDRDNLTLFAGRADFRGCQFASAQFEFTEFRGETSFVNAVFGAAGATFSNASFGNALTDFSGVRLNGPLVLTDAYFPALRLYWHELGPALLAAEPDTKVLTALHERLQAVGDTGGALDASYHLARRRFIEDVSVESLTPPEGMLAFFDVAGRRLVLYGEWLLWGWPTGYGTKFGRIALLALACWLVSAVPVVAGGRLLARIVITTGADSQKSNGPSRAYEPLILEDEPHEKREPKFSTSGAECLYLALGFTFRLLFKVGPSNIRYIAKDERSGSCVTWRAYFALLWYLGSGLLVLLTLTLANSSPMISRLVGELAP